MVADRISRLRASVLIRSASSGSFSVLRKKILATGPDSSISSSNCPATSLSASGVSAAASSRSTMSIHFCAKSWTISSSNCSREEK